MSFSNRCRNFRYIVAVLLTAAFIFSAAAPASFAASASTGKGYVSISFKPVKSGKNYYKRTKALGIARSKKQSSGYKTILKNCYWGACTNGKYIYYTTFDSNSDFWYLVRCSSSGGNHKYIKKLPYEKDSINRYYISTIYKGNAYLYRCFTEENGTYRYNFKTGKLVRVSKSSEILDRSGKYVLTSDYSNGISYARICRITSSGKIKRIKTLFINRHNDNDTDMRFDGRFVGGKLYYSITADTRLKETMIIDGDEFTKSISKVRFYKCNNNGKGLKKLGTVTMDGSGWSAGFTSKYCDLLYSQASWTEDYTCYRYYYSTGKLKKLSKSYLDKNYFYRHYEL